MRIWPSHDDFFRSLHTPSGIIQTLLLNIRLALTS